MRCLDPFVKQGSAFPCGKCLPCLKYRARVWSHRIMLEARQHAENAFVTLTYSEEHVPDQLSPDHTCKWLKRLRTEISPIKLRFYLCGEYGDLHGRPHYHAALFGVGQWISCAVEKTWPFGFVSVGSLTVESAQYIAGYVTKKSCENARPTFSRMSRMPGLGVGALWDVASETMRYGLDPSPALRQGKVVRPLGRHLRGKLHEFMATEPPEFVPSREVRLVQDFAWNNSRSLKEVWSEVNASNEVYKKRGSL